MRKYKTDRHYTDLGRLLQRTRQANGLTQREVSLKLGYSSAQFISNFENGIASPPLKKLAVIIKMYGLKPEPVIAKFLQGERKAIVAGLTEVA